MGGRIAKASVQARSSAVARGIVVSFGFDDSKTRGARTGATVKR
jgi:hypothetical protein